MSSCSAGIKSFCCLALSFLAIPTSLAKADDGATSQPGYFDPPAYAISFVQPQPFADKQRWTFEVLGTGVADVSNKHVAIYGVTAGVGYYFWQNMAIMLDVSGYGYNQGHTDGAATGATLGLRHHLFSVGKSSVFVDCSGGVIEASNNLPAGGTHLNNTIEAGLGVASPIRDNMYLLTGVRFFHISNARSEGADRNPSINGIQGVIGVMWKF